MKLLGLACVASPSGRQFFCELVVDKLSDLQPLLDGPQTKHWDKHVTRREVVEPELRNINPGASLERLRVRMP